MAFCSRCAAPNLDSAMACSACGVSLGSPPMPGAPTAAPYTTPPVPGSYAPYYNMPTSNGLAIGGFVCGCLGLLCGVAAVPGLILSIIGFNQVRRSNGEMRGAGIALAGIIVSSVFILLYGVIFLAGLFSGHSGHHHY